MKKKRPKLKAKVLARSPARSMRNILKELQGIRAEFMEIADKLNRPEEQ